MTVRRLVVALVATATVAGVLAMILPRAEATRRATSISGFDLPEEVTHGRVVTDRFHVGGPAGRVIRLQHRAPGRAWQTLTEARTDRRGHAIVRLKVVVDRSDEVTWSGRMGGGGPWTVAARTFTGEREFRIWAKGSPAWQEGASRVELVRTVPTAKAPTVPTARVCDSASLNGPAKAPAGAVVVQPGANLARLTTDHPPGTTFYLERGVHRVYQHEFGQVIPKEGNSYIGAPGAVFDGNNINRYAFTMSASNVTIKYLTVRGFVAPGNEGVVNHDAGASWVIAHNTIEDNRGAAVFIGNKNLVQGNCLRNNGQYGFNGDGRDIVVRGNEIAGNNTDDWESKGEGCGCSGAGKFWGVVGAVVEENYVHDNYGAGLWADGLISDFLIRANFIEGNEGPGILYEQGYNATIVHNTLIGNNHKKGLANYSFPEGAMYISEAGADPRAPGGHTRFEIVGNLLIDNWGGVTLWENADRFAGSASDTSGVGTLIPGVTLEKCLDQELIKTEPYYSDCRWSTKNVKIHDNVFRFDPDNVPRCDADGNPRCGHMGMGSNWGTVPSWSPYMGDVIQQAISHTQGNEWYHNTYSGPWRFVAEDIFSSISWDEWRRPPLSQDAGSTFDQGAFASAP